VKKHITIVSAFSANNEYAKWPVKMLFWKRTSHVLVVAIIFRSY